MSLVRRPRRHGDETWLRQGPLAHTHRWWRHALVPPTMEREHVLGLELAWRRFHRDLCLEMARRWELEGVLDRRWLEGVSISELGFRRLFMGDFTRERVAWEGARARQQIRRYRDYHTIAERIL